MRRRLLGLALVVLLAPVSAGAQGEVVEYYGLDAIGSVRIVFNAEGHVVTRMDYTPFGGELFGASGLPDQRFAGLFRDGEAGLDYAQARSYQVRTGRFNAPDPVYAAMFDPQRWNRYTYAVSSPFSFVDPTGLQDKEVQPQCKPGAPGQIYYCPGTIRIDLGVTVTAPSPVSPISLATAIGLVLAQPSRPTVPTGPHSMSGNTSAGAGTVSGVSGTSAPPGMRPPSTIPADPKWGDPSTWKRVDQPGKWTKWVPNVRGPGSKPQILWDAADRYFSYDDGRGGHRVHVDPYGRVVPPGNMPWWFPILESMRPLLPIMVNPCLTAPSASYCGGGGLPTGGPG